MVFHWCLRDGKPPQVPMTLLGILAYFNNAVIWTISTRSVSSKSFSPCTILLVTVLRVSISIGMIVSFMFHSYFKSLVRSRYLSHFSHFFNFTPWSSGSAKSIILQVLSFLLLIISPFVLPRLGDSFVFQNPTGACISYPPVQILACAYTICSHSQICCIRLFHYSSFSHHHDVAYICCFAASYLFSLRYGWFLCRCFVLLLGKIQFLPQSFLFLVTTTFSRVRCHVLVA